MKIEKHVLECFSFPTQINNFSLPWLESEPRITTTEVYYIVLYRMSGDNNLSVHVTMLMVIPLDTIGIAMPTAPSQLKVAW